MVSLPEVHFPIACIPKESQNEAAYTIGLFVRIDIVVSINSSGLRKDLSSSQVIPLNARLERRP
jgi:hypothetical protein